MDNDTDGQSNFKSDANDSRNEEKKIYSNKIEDTIFGVVNQIPSVTKELDKEEGNNNNNNNNENEEEEEEEEEENEGYGTARNIKLQLSTVRDPRLLNKTENLDYLTKEEVSQHSVLEETVPDKKLILPSSSLSLLTSENQQQQEEEKENTKEKITSDDVLRKHKKHVFILTSAGKPIFTRYGDESDFSDLFGIFQVLIAMSDQRCNNNNNNNNNTLQSSQQKLYKQSNGSLRRVIAGNMSMYFHVEGELYYVLVTRTGESVRSCLKQLRQVHLQLLSLVPNVSDILLRSPSYDIRRLISSTDVNVIRQLIKRNSHDECYIFRSLAAAPLSSVRRRWLESILARYHGTGFINDKNNFFLKDQTLETNTVTLTSEHHLYSFFLFRGRIVCAVGPPNSDAILHIDDALLLLNFTRCLSHSQAGEIWAPICLPKYNNSGYLWCYCANMSVMARESRRGRIESTSFEYNKNLSRENQELSLDNPLERETQRQSLLIENSNISNATFETLINETPLAFRKSEGLLLVHIAASQGAFTALAEQAYKIARQLLSVIGKLEEELAQRERISLSIFIPDYRIHQDQQRREIVQLLKLAEKQQKQQQCENCNNIPPSSSSSSSPPPPPPPPPPNSIGISNSFNLLSPQTFIHPDGLQWCAIVLRGQRGREGASTIICSEPSITMRQSVKERKRQLRLVLKQRDQLSQLSHSPEPLLLLQMKDMNILVIRPIPTLVASLVQQFSTLPMSEFSSLNSQVVENSNNDNNNLPILVNEAVASCNRVREIMLIFLPHITKQRMLMCAIRVMIRSAVLEKELSFQQIRAVQ